MFSTRGRVYLVYSGSTRVPYRVRPKQAGLVPGVGYTWYTLELPCYQLEYDQNDQV